MSLNSRRDPQRSHSLRPRLTSGGAIVSLHSCVRSHHPLWLSLALRRWLARVHPSSHRALHLQYNTHRKIMIRTKGIFHVGSKFHLDWVLVPLTT